MMRPAFWLAALQIMGINILLSGDNAVVIALAVRALPPKERFWGMVLGAGAAAVLLIVFTGIVATLMQLPYLKLAGGLALFWVADQTCVAAAARRRRHARSGRGFVAGGSCCRRRKYRDESRQCDCRRGSCERQLFSARARPCGQHSCRHCRQRPVPGDHRAFPDRRMGRRRFAGLDCGRLVAGRSRSLREYFSEATADMLEVVCGIAGAIFVVLVGLYLVKSGVCGKSRYRRPIQPGKAIAR